jgi:hypothetical protein
VLFLQTSNFSIKSVFNFKGVGIEFFCHALSIGLFYRYMFISWIRHSDTHILQNLPGIYLQFLIESPRLLTLINAITK